MKHVVVIAAAALAFPAFAQPGESPGTLAGPKVKARVETTSLVERDMGGRLKRLDIPAEEAALALLKLDPASKKKVDAVLSQRASILDEIVRENIELIGQIAGASQAGDRVKVVELVREIAPKFQPLSARGRLIDELKSALPEKQAAELERLVKEYQEALWQDAQAESKAEGKAIRPAEFAGRERLAAIGQEIKRSYDRQFASKQQRFEKLLGELALPPEKETKVRNLVTDHAQKYRLNPTPQQNRELFFRIMGALNLQEQGRLLRLIREERGEP